MDTLRQVQGDVIGSADRVTFFRSADNEEWSSQAFTPSGGRWHGTAVTDEGNSDYVMLSLSKHVLIFIMRTPFDRFRVT